MRMSLGGWYTSPGCFPGSEYVPGSTMPEHDISLYAKWEPVTYTVRLFKNRKDMETYQTTGKEELVYHTQVVDHGSTLGEIADPPTRRGMSIPSAAGSMKRAGKRSPLPPLIRLSRRICWYTPSGAISPRSPI